MDNEDDTRPQPDIGFPSRPLKDTARSDAMPVFHGPSTIHRGPNAHLRLPPTPPVVHLPGHDAHDSGPMPAQPVPPFAPGPVRSTPPFAPTPVQPVQPVQPFAPAPVRSAGPASTSGGRDRPDRHLVVPLLLAVALAAVGAWGSIEHQSAGRWKERHAQATDVVHETNVALTGAEADLLETEGTLAVERDLSAQLGDEKADLADQRTQLADLLATAPAVTDALRICSTAMASAVEAAIDLAIDLIGDSYASFASLDSAIERAVADCDTAQLLAGDLETGISDLGL
jgi:hypothetical protein